MQIQENPLPLQKDGLLYKAVRNSARVVVAGQRESGEGLVTFLDRKKSYYGVLNCRRIGQIWLVVVGLKNL